jgi:hypothetical protein
MGPSMGFTGKVWGDEDIKMRVVLDGSDDSGEKSESIVPTT